jgi:regulator of RNase E activity RraB
MLFEVEDIRDFERCINDWKKNLSDFSLEIIEDKAWVLYNELQPDEYALQQIGNRQVYEQLIKYGSNPAKIHLIEHAIHGNSTNLEKLEAELLKEDGKTLIIDTNTLEVTFECILDLEQINNMTYFLLDISKEFNCQYNGWSANIVR